jgi:hypothetical protein
MAGTTEFHQPGRETLTMKIDPVQTQSPKLNYPIL